MPALGLVLAAAAEIILLRLFPLGGPLGFPVSQAAAALTFCAIGIACTIGQERARVLRFVFAAYAIAIAVFYVVPSGLGENVARLRYLALPLALLVLALRRWRPVKVSIVVAALALSWNVTPLAAGWARGNQDVSSRAKVWRAPVSYLHAHLRPGYRVEAVDTTDHWPAYYLASARIPLARGWFRQDDFPFDALLYRHRLGAVPYLRWLRRLGVAYVVLTRSPPDYSSRAEARLIRSGRTDLRPVFSTRGDLDLRRPPAAADPERARPADGARVPRVAARRPRFTRRDVRGRRALVALLARLDRLSARAAATGWSSCGRAGRESCGSGST